MMFSVAAMLLTSPMSCAGLETLEWRLCQPRVIYLGPWSPAYWDYAAPDVYYREPADYGTYSLERKCPEP